MSCTKPGGKSSTCQLQGGIYVGCKDCFWKAIPPKIGGGSKTKYLKGQIGFDGKVLEGGRKKDEST